MEATKNYRMELIVHGKVQGVGYRFFVSDIAEELGITGQIKNNPDGTVTIIAEGDKKSLDDFQKKINIKPLTKFEKEALLKEGKIIPPQPLAKVTKIERKEFIETPREFKTFTVVEEKEYEKEMLSAIRTGSRSMDALRYDVYHNFFVMDKKYGDISNGMKRVADMLHKDFRLLIYVLIALALVTIIMNIIK